jgi:hypothetical protein
MYRHQCFLCCMLERLKDHLFCVPGELIGGGLVHSVAGLVAGIVGFAVSLPCLLATSCFAPESPR